MNEYKIEGERAGERNKDSEAHTVRKRQRERDLQKLDRQRETKWERKE